MNKETQLRKLIREELMKEGLFDKAKDYAQGIARSYMDDIKSATGYKKYRFRIAIEYNKDGGIEVMDLDYSPSDRSESDVRDAFDRMFYNSFKFTFDILGRGIDADEAEEISEFLTNNSFIKTERNTSNGRLEVFTRELSLKDINDMRGL